MVRSDVVESLTDDQRKYLNCFDDSEPPFHPTLDIFLCVIYPYGHMLHGGENDPDGWARHWSSEHNSDWLKGFVVIPFR